MLASHELRTPLTALRLDLEGARRANITSEEVREKLARAETQIDRVARLVTDMLVVSKLRPAEQLRPTEIGAGALLLDLVKTFADHRRTRDIVTQLPAEGLVGCWDRDELEDVLRRLLTNAIKYGPDGPIELRLERHGSTARFRSPIMASASRPKIASELGKGSVFTIRLPLAVP